MSKQPMSRKSGAAQTSSSPGKKFEKEQAEAAAAGSKLVAALEAEKKVRSDLEETVAQDTQIIAAMDTELEETKKASFELEIAMNERAQEAKRDALRIYKEQKTESEKLVSEQAELIDRLKAEGGESRGSSGEFEKLLAAEREKYAALEAKEAVGGADPSVLVLLQSIIKHSPNCDTSGGGIMHKQCRRHEPCLFRRARQLLAGHGMEI